MENRRIRETPYKNTPAIFLGAMMILAAVLMLATRFTVVEFMGYELKVEDNAFGIFSRILLLIGGSIILIKRNNGNYFATGVYALTLGTSRIIRSLPNLMSDSEEMYYLSIFMIIVGINLAITGYNHLTVRMKNPVIMRYTTMSIIATYLIILMYFAYIGEDPGLLFQYVPDTIWYIPLYVGLLIVLFSKEVTENSPLGRIRGFSTTVADRSYLGDRIDISEEDAEKIKSGFRNPSSWKTLDIQGEQVSEEMVTFKTRRGDKDVILNRWPDEDSIYLTVVDDRMDSFIDGYRIRISSYTENEGMMELNDDIGICTRLYIKGCE